jgi:hypothetical protein
MQQTHYYEGESRMLDSPEGICAGQAGFEYPATSVPFSKAHRWKLEWMERISGNCGQDFILKVEHST